MKFSIAIVLLLAAVTLARDIPAPATKEVKEASVPVAVLAAASVPVAKDVAAAKDAVATTAKAVVAPELTAEQKEKRATIEQACVKEVGANEEAVKKLHDGDYSSKDEKVKCFTKCVMQKAGFLNDKGEFQEQQTIDKLAKGGDKAVVVALVNKCKSTKSTNACDNAYEMHECYSKAKAF